MRLPAILGLCLIFSSLSEAQQPAVDAFARLPAMAHPTLSPDGSRIAYIANDGDASALYILNLETGDRGGVGTSQIRPYDLVWAGNDYVIMLASDTERFTLLQRRNPIDVSAAFSVEAANPSNVVQLTANDRQIHSMDVRRGNIVAVDHDNGNVFIPGYEAPRQSGVNSFRMSDAQQRPRYSLWRVAADGGNVWRQMQGLPDQRTWLVASDGSPLAREYFDDDRNQYRFDAYRDGDWSTVLDLDNPVFQSIVWGLFNTEEAAVSLYVDGYGSLRPVSLETGNATGDDIAVSGRDILAVHEDPYTGFIAGIEFADDYMRTVWLDDELQGLQDALVNALGDPSTTITSWSRDRTRYIVRTDGASATPIYYFYDDASRNLSILAAEYPELETATLGQREAFEYTARDGASISGFVTRPASGGSNLPTVILPHGGPETLDAGGFDWIAHFLASRGYLVIQPNFRGSDGFGVEFRDAGRGAWGTGVAQHDVTDALHHAVQQGWADAGRVCIFGGSYGGYSALAGGAFTPDLYACVAAYAPVTDLGLFLGETEIRGGAGNWVADAWAEILGGVVTADDRQRLDDVSPIHNTRAFQAPVLLMHGREDSVVPIAQSRRFEEEMEDDNQAIEYVELRTADHWLTSQATRTEVLTRLEAFLAEHIGN
ncbi:prolyl oligopeptidase family serine peptidase [Hyphobacterium sp. HN65]|uniref:Prolyl oligopeptidase family serine peptidase n=1 Tax=Hyphobacterium lacteum TaxID=3116575 RepID=A0ABU7LTC6_9PROT|nr:prolyl oligopeptidase family serine peptidase [Hyphobacterium sp. HN65]MEE2527151.1 prolyl oligopeptidase family serine peptidase [Hyphobacterium sp. HN65]